jgi:hypothetical protein
MLGLLLIAHIRDNIQGHVENKNLNNARVGRSNNLSHEHCSRRDLHVMAKFEIRNKVKRLGPREDMSRLLSK